MRKPNKVEMAVVTAVILVGLGIYYLYALFVAGIIEGMVGG